MRTKAIYSIIIKRLLDTIFSRLAFVCLAPFLIFLSLWVKLGSQGPEFLNKMPQIFNILMGQMSIISPHPAIWNQEDLIYERDMYDVNVVTPDLTVWAQVNGHDELEIDEKARLDGAYYNNIRFAMDWTCFRIIIANILKRKGVDKGGTGMMAKQVENRQAEIMEHDINEKTADMS